MSHTSTQGASLLSFWPRLALYIWLSSFEVQKFIKPVIGALARQLSFELRIYISKCQDVGKLKHAHVESESRRVIGKIYKKKLIYYRR